ncbi:unnamed protein product [Caenorhabditis auriculariae]|uniref:Protein phosphatase inhibitor 2 n=1 Tax=Caenorhabditis auriculariae TaxID=2777116 RepID=A0A8S1HGF3_9PELO|nr:unnamed protein product [Caenorhabditis auriculariae]
MADGQEIEEGRHNLEDPAEYLKLKPKKSILKMKQDSSMEGKDGRAHFDEMNILATYHPADKDYGNMKIDEPKTPYNHSDVESECDESSSSSANRQRRVSLGTAVDPEQVAEGLAGGPTRPTPIPPDESDDEETMSEEQRAHKREFEKKRKAHYNEGAALKHHLPSNDDEEDEKME